MKYRRLNRVGFSDGDLFPNAQNLSPRRYETQEVVDRRRWIFKFVGVVTPEIVVKYHQATRLEKLEGAHRVENDIPGAVRSIHIDEVKKVTLG